MPFMAVLANPDVIHSNSLLQQVYQSLEFEDSQTFLRFLGVVVFSVLLVSVSVNALTTWAITHFTQMLNYTIASRLTAAYFAQPYEWYLNRHSADLAKSVVSEVQMVVAGALIPSIQLVAQGALILAIVAFLLVLNPVIAIAMGVGIGGSYFLIYYFLRLFLDRTGRDRVTANRERFRALSESFGAIKQIKLSGLEGVALRRFDLPAKRFARTQVSSQLIGQLPRYALEIAAFGGILLLTVYLIGDSGGLQSVLPVIATYAFAAYRLLPAIQIAYSHATRLRFSGEAIEATS